MKEEKPKRQRNDIPKPCLVRLARKGGVKSISEECFERLRTIIKNKVQEVLETVSIINEDKIVSTEDLYQALAINGIMLTKSTELGIKNVLKK